MQAAGLTPDTRAGAPALAAGLRPILTGLATLIARAFLKDPRHVGIILLLWNRLNRAARRFDLLMARVAAGTAQSHPRPARAAIAGAAPPPVPAHGTALQRLPTRKAWLLAALKHEAAFYRNRLVALLDAPATAATLAATPQAISLLRPLCRMLGVTHAAIPPRASRPAAASPAAIVLANEQRTPSPQAAKSEGGAIRTASPAGREPPPPPLSETVPCPHVFWPWFPRHKASRA